MAAEITSMHTLVEFFFVFFSSGVKYFFIFRNLDWHEDKRLGDMCSRMKTGSAEGKREEINTCLRERGLR